jgi:hypothetical protein
MVAETHYYSMDGWSLDKASMHARTLPEATTPFANRPSHLAICPKCNIDDTTPLGCVMLAL